MTHILKISTGLAALLTATMLTACGPSGGGYYDSNGNWVGPANATTAAQRTHSPDSSQNYEEHSYQPGGRGNGAVTRTTTVTTYYDRAGYYDAQGYYVAQDAAPAIPPGMFPPHGACRVWFEGRPADRQPAIESCDGIRDRVPAGAYVVYGG